MDKISIIVPVYKVEQFLRRCVGSLRRQTYTDLEIILVDDGSPDNCGRICDAYAREDDRIKVIHRENGGLCAARNSGLRAATGDYIGFIDSDDYAEPDMFEYLLKSIKEYDADIVSCGFYKVKSAKEIQEKKPCEEPEVCDGPGAVKALLERPGVKSAFWNKLFKKEVFDGVEFPEGYVFEGTRMMHNIFLKCDKIVLLPEPKYYYIDNVQSIVNDKSIKNQIDYVDSQIMRFNDIAELYPENKQKMMVKIVREIATLTKICYIHKDSYKDFIPNFALISDFLNKNAEYIDSIKWKNVTAKYNMAFAKDPGDSTLEEAHNAQQKYDTPKAKALTAELEAASTRVVKKKKMRTNVEDLTIEDKEIFQKLHETEQELLDELVRICEKYGLKYYLYGGTLLGAVRHKGFIPWDDDIDIAMTRADYDKLTEVAQQELGDKYYYQSIETDEKTPYLYAKIRKNNTWVQEEWLRGSDMHQGIFIDIMPLDYFPEVNEKKRAKILGRFNALHAAAQQSRIRTGRKLWRIKYNYYNKRYTKRQIREKRDKYIRSVAGGKETSLVCSFGSHYKPLSRRIFPAWWFTDDGTTMEFEGKQYMVPKGWKEYLVHLYGESYMEWPPIEKRVNHFNYYEISFDTTKENKENG